MNPMSDHTLLRWHRFDSDGSQRRTGAERRTGEDRRGGDRRQELSPIVEVPCAVEPVRVGRPASPDFVTPWQLADPVN
jgi:hypothetical protein